MRQTMYTYDLLFFINADERREKDPDYRVAYSAVSLPLIRCMIDCLYNITLILTNPGLMGYKFRASGYRKMLASLDEDEARYGGDPKWDDWIAKVRAFALAQLIDDGFTETEVPKPTTGVTNWRKLAPTVTSIIIVGGMRMLTAGTPTGIGTIAITIANVRSPPKPMANPRARVQKFSAPSLSLFFRFIAMLDQELDHVFAFCPHIKVSLCRFTLGTVCCEQLAQDADAEHRARTNAVASDF